MSRPARQNLLPYQLQMQTDLSSKLRLVEEALDGRFDSQMIESVAAALKPSNSSLVEWSAALPATPNGAYLHALLATSANHGSIGAWERFFALTRPEPLHRLAYARALS